MADKRTNYGDKINIYNLHQFAKRTKLPASTPAGSQPQDGATQDALLAAEDRELAWRRKRGGGGESGRGESAWRRRPTDERDRFGSIRQKVAASRRPIPEGRDGDRGQRRDILEHAPDRLDKLAPSSDHRCTSLRSVRMKLL